VRNLATRRDWAIEENVGPPAVTSPECLYRRNAGWDPAVESQDHRSWRSGHAARVSRGRPGESMLGLPPARILRQPCGVRPSRRWARGRSMLSIRVGPIHPEMRWFEFTVVQPGPGPFYSASVRRCGRQKANCRGEIANSHSTFHPLLQQNLPIPPAYLPTSSPVPSTALRDASLVDPFLLLPLIPPLRVAATTPTTLP
jgi:hypothetical protein